MTKRKRSKAYYEAKRQIDFMTAVQILKILTPVAVRLCGGRMTKKRWEMLRRL